MIDLKDKNVLVTGASGLLGRPLVDKLIERGAIVRATGWESPAPKDWPQAAEYMSADLSRNRSFPLVGLFEDIEYVFHLAGAKGGVGIGRTKSADFLMANLRTTIAFLDGLRNWHENYEPTIKRILFTSSVGAYPGKYSIFQESQLEDGPPHESDYFGGYAKRFGEVLCKAYREQYGLDCVIVRPTNCYGPYDRFDPKTGMVIAALIARIEAGENPLTVWGDGSAERDFLYSKDAAEQMIAVMERGESGEAYNLGTGQACSIKHLLMALRSTVYPTLEWNFDASKPSGPKLRQMDMRKTFALGGISFHGNHRGVFETVEWYRENKNYQKYDPFKG
jgi:GDP-L-fucose synthase